MEEAARRRLLFLLLLSAVDHWLAAEADGVAPIGADAAPVVVAGAGAGAGAGVAAGAGAVVAGASSFLPQAASATAETRVANRSDLFMLVLSEWCSS
jgi:hypothetical protein